MNERIKELAKEAGYNKIFDTDAKAKIRLLKYTELIIKECVLQCFHNEDMDRILNHFGMLIEDEELEDGCPCGHDGGTSCGAINCEY